MDRLGHVTSKKMAPVILLLLAHFTLPKAGPLVISLDFQYEAGRLSSLMLHFMQSCIVEAWKHCCGT